MVEKRNYKKNIKRVILILILILILFIILYFSNPITIAKMRLNSLNNSKLPKDIKIPEYVNFVVETTDIKPESIIKYYNNLVINIIPKYFKKCRNFTDNEINEYFKRNKKIIELEIGVTEEKDFRNIIENIKKLNNDQFNLERYYILDNSIEKNNNETIVYVGIKYQDCDDIYFRSIIEKKYQKEKTSIKFDCNTEIEKIKEGNRVLEEREEKINNTPSPYKRGSPIE